MMDIRPRVLSPNILNSPKDLKPLFSVLTTRDDRTMIIDTSNHSSSMLVSPKKGETITEETISKQEPQLSSPSLSPSSWEIMSPKQKLSLTSATPSVHTSTVVTQSWPSPSSRFASQMKTLTDTDAFQTGDIHSENPCDSWGDSKNALKSTLTPSSESSSPQHLLSPSEKRDDSEEMEEHAAVTLSDSKMSARNCDRPDSSPSPQSQLNSSFDESEQPGAEVGGQNVDINGTNSAGLFGNLERRSRRKPTTGDIVRCVRPPVDAPPYDSEDSEVEDDIIHKEMLTKLNGEENMDDESKTRNEVNGNGRFKDEYPRHFPINRLSRLEAADGMHEDDEEEMEMQSDSDSIEDSDKHAFLNEVPLSIYNLMHEAKVNAHMTFMKTINSQSPNEAKLKREQYLLQLLSNLKDRCLEEGLKPQIIGSVLKDVETEVTILCEDLEDMKMKQYFSSSNKDPNFPSAETNENHFLSKPEIKIEGKDKPEAFDHDSSYSSANSTSFFNTTSMSSPLPTSSSNSSSPSSNSKPIIMTVSADMKLPMSYPRGGSVVPHHPLTSNTGGEHNFNPMFPNGKMGSWFPPELPLYFNYPGSLDFSPKFFNLDGKIGENLDKDYLKCQFCERTFRRQKNLENHVESTHQGKGPLKPKREAGDMYFKCSHCPYTTKHQSNLYVHLRIHTGERPYICGACGVQYSQSHSLKSHIINKHDGIMSYYIKEKRTRSPRGMGYLSTQIMHDSGMIKLPGPVSGSPMQHNMDIVNKAIEMVRSENAKHQENMKHQQQSMPSSDADPNVLKNMMPPPLSAIISNSNNSSSMNANNNTQTNNVKSPATQNSGLGNDHSMPMPNSMFSPPGVGPHLPFFMGGHPLMFGELPPHIRNPNHLGGGHHPPAHHSFFPGFHQFPPNNSNSFISSTGLSPLSGISPDSSPALSTENPHQNLPSHFPASLPHIQPPLSPFLQQVKIKKEPQSVPKTPISTKQSLKVQSDEAIDLRKKSPPLDAKEQHAYDLNICGGKENCLHAAKLKYLRLNVVRMLGILVPNLNFAEKGISEESESVDELLQDVIESNTHDDLDSSE